jgi:hypothetical protein
VSVRYDWEDGGSLPVAQRVVLEDATAEDADIWKGVKMDRGGGSGTDGTGDGRLLMGKGRSWRLVLSDIGISRYLRVRGTCAKNVSTPFPRLAETTQSMGSFAQEQPSRSPKPSEQIRRPRSQRVHTVACVSPLLTQ